MLARHLSVSFRVVVTVAASLVFVAAPRVVRADVYREQEQAFRRNDSRAGAELLADALFSAPAPNQWPYPQIGTSDPTVTLFGRLADTTDVDFFSFYGRGGETVQMDMDNDSVGQWPEVSLFVFGSGGNLIARGDAGGGDPGSSGNFFDALLRPSLLPAPDLYYLVIAQTTRPLTISASGEPTFGPVAPGAYGPSGGYRIEFSRNFQTQASVPEPGTLALAAVSALLPLAAQLHRRRRQRRGDALRRPRQ